MAEHFNSVDHYTLLDLAVTTHANSPHLDEVSNCIWLYWQNGFLLSLNYITGNITVTRAAQPDHADPRYHDINTGFRVSSSPPPGPPSSTSHPTHPQAAQPLAITMPPTRKPIPAWEVVRQHVPRFAYSEIPIPNALHTHYRNVNVTLSAGLFTFQRTTEAPYCCFVTFWNVIHRDIRMTPTMLWGLIQCVDNQYYCDHGTTISDWMHTMSLYDPPPQAVTSWPQHVLDPPHDVP